MARQLAGAFAALEQTLAASAHHRVAQSRYLKAYIRAQESVAQRATSDAKALEALHRAEQALRLRTFADEAHAMRLKYTGSKLTRPELLRRTAAHVGLAMPQTGGERAERARVRASAPPLNPFKDEVKAHGQED